MVGDGINDSAALAQADLSIAMGTGSDIAMDVAGITLLKGDLGKLSEALRLCRRRCALPRLRLPAQPHDSRGGHGVQQRQRGDKQPAVETMPAVKRNQLLSHTFSAATRSRLT